MTIPADAEDIEVSDYGKILARYWQAGSGAQLRGDPWAMLVGCYIFTAPTARPVGIYYLPIPTIAHDLGTDVATCTAALEKVCDTGIAMYDVTESLVWVPELARVSLGPTLSPKDKRRGWILKEAQDRVEHHFYGLFLDRYERDYELGTLPRGRPSEAPSMGHAIFGKTAHVCRSVAVSVASLNPLPLLGGEKPHPIDAPTRPPAGAGQARSTTKPRVARGPKPEGAAETRYAALYASAVTRATGVPFLPPRRPGSILGPALSLHATGPSGPLKGAELDAWISDTVYDFALKVGHEAAYWGKLSPRGFADWLQLGRQDRRPTTPAQSRAENRGMVTAIRHRKGIQAPAPKGQEHWRSDPTLATEPGGIFHDLPDAEPS